jgi:blue copper oxidase
MKRRDFLCWSFSTIAFTAATSVTLSACKTPPEATSADVNAPQALKLPTIVTGGTLTATYGSAQVRPGPLTSVLMINGNALAPTVKVQTGDAFNATFQNGLGEPSIIHWHGLSLPAEMDGHPKYAVASGQSYNYSFPIIQRAATYWYHAHPDKLTAKQAYLGFAGVFIVHDSEEQALNLPSGKYDVPVLLQDKRIASDNTIEYAPTREDIITGYLGNTVLTNGTPNAFLEVEQTLYRFRIINASNARVYQLGFSDNRTFHLIATDGGLIEQSAPLQVFNLSPAERAEILVDLSKDALGSTLTLKSFAYDFVSEHRGDTYPQGMELKILELRVTTANSNTVTIPTTLATYEKLDAASAVKTQVFELTMDHSKPAGIHMINDLVFSMDRIDIHIKQGDVEIWQFNNTGDGYHSMHVHGTQFQILERLYAGPMTPIDFGWKDTVLLYPNESVRILVRFKDYKGVYLLHCHTLEHEDDGMMLNVLVS